MSFSDAASENRRLLYLCPNGAEEVLHNEITTGGWDVEVVHSVEAAKSRLHEQHFPVGLVLVHCYDDRLHHQIEDLLVSHPRMEWVAMLEPDCLHSADCRRLIRAGFHDYHTLPAEPGRLLLTLGHAHGMVSLAQHALPDEGADDHEMVGASPVMQTLFRTLRKIAGVDAPVLITGESGTGKELAARALHDRSARAKAPFVAVNCGALPANLIQSELFGHEKGAFTGALARKIGRIEAARGGTIFLDEIGDLSLDLQVNLLRFLQEKTIDRVGGNESIPIDVRVIAATHVNLERAVKEGRFREDLYYRLNVLHLHTPPLRDRDDDIELLARFFFEAFGREKKRGLRGFSREALAMMRRHDWPGNVREMINRIRRAMVMCESRMISAADLGLDKRADRRRLMTLDEARERAEKEVIRHCLRQTDRNLTEAADHLGISRATLYRLMQRHALLD
jgi:DNA-binding NtrC family response regulator